jgi:hypothetical protein
LYWIKIANATATTAVCENLNNLAVKNIILESFEANADIIYTNFAKAFD